ncbi:hypothetical protein HK098_006450 [Nowakowskiella sp. JEL0407]|nr:hypothetical protein HK098_006450 [Nowakowskiella sp. JEL0407]
MESSQDNKEPPKINGISLNDILDGKVESITNSLVAEEYDGEMDESDNDSPQNAKPPKSGFCVECEDQPAELYCEQCTDDFCKVCYAAQHRKGTRKKHTSKKLEVDYSLIAPSEGSSQTQPSKVQIDGLDFSQNATALPTTIKDKAGTWFLERSKFIPVRLNLTERKYLRLLEAALNVSEYTDKIDIISYQNKGKRIVAQIKELCSILSGLVLAADYQAGQNLFENKSFEDNSEFFQAIFEFGRRHKIMNPDKMRSTYGKLIYLLMDSQIPEIKEMLQFDCIKEIKTVYKVLEAKNGLKVLEDDLITFATQEIIPTGKSRTVVQYEIKQKERAIEQLARKYSSQELTADEIKQCLYSIGDNHAFLRTNRDPCDKMIEWLKHYFHPEEQEKGYSLAIKSGKHGARLTHDHLRQYAYVLQSLTLWREVLHDMFQLWYLAEQDLLDDSNPYRLRDTGQGLNRVQNAPRTSRIMHNILHRAQGVVNAQRVGSWVGSSVIHLGDHNVPNSLFLIDKYTQIHSILNPIVLVLEQIETLSKADEGVNLYLREVYGGVDKARKDILVDFFRHGFDGSGADNFFDAGSCVDGRLTSAWNWCHNIHKKNYYPLFKLCGFIGFDADSK